MTKTIPRENTEAAIFMSTTASKKSEGLTAAHSRGSDEYAGGSIIGGLMPWDADGRKTGEFILSCLRKSGEGSVVQERGGASLVSLLCWIGIVALILITCLAGCVNEAWAGNTSTQYSDEQIVNAIYKAEGGAKAQYLYGIRSITYKDAKEARRICFNTVRNNRVRFAKQTKYKDYLVFLASRYCPVGCDNDNGTNKYWIKNVRYFLEAV